jgi:arsenate reductase-like glutaredoxin family protein
MNTYVRYAVTIQLPDERVLAAALDLVKQGEPRPYLKKIRDFKITDHEKNRTYIINFDHYYVVCPECMAQIKVPVPDEVSLNEQLASPDDTNARIASHDLLPCPQCFTAIRDLKVLMESEYKQMIHVQPFRKRATELDKAVQIVEFGTIQLTEARRSSYKWQPQVRKDKNTSTRNLLKRMLNKSKYKKYIIDENGRFEIGFLEREQHDDRQAEENEARKKVDEALKALEEMEDSR